MSQTVAIQLQPGDQAVVLVDVVKITENDSLFRDTRVAFTADRTHYASAPTTRVTTIEELVEFFREHPLSEPWTFEELCDLTRAFFAGPEAIEATYEEIRLSYRRPSNVQETQTQEAANG